MEERKPKTGIRSKVTLLVVSAVLITMVAGLSLNYFLEFNLVRNRIGEEHAKIADRLVLTISEMLDDKVKDVEVHVNNLLWRDLIFESNANYEKMKEEDIPPYLMGLNDKWNRASDNSSLVESVLSNRGSRRLKEICALRRELVVILVTDKFGKAIVASEKPTFLYAGDKNWWQKAYDNPEQVVFLGGIEFDKAHNLWGASLAFSIKDNDGKVIAVCKAILKVENFFAPLTRVKIGKTGKALLIDDKGDILFGEGKVPHSLEASGYIGLQKFLKRKQKWGIVVQNFHGHKKNSFVAFAKVDDPSLLESGISWWVLIAQDANEVFVPLRELILQLAIVKGTLLIILIPLGFIFGGIFVKPIKKLHEATEKIGQGDLDYRIEVKTGDEIEQLADSFSSMVSSIKEKQKEILAEKVYANGIISSIIDTLIVVNPDATLKSVNRATCDLLGYKEDELIGKDVSLIFTEEEEEEEEEALFKGKRLRRLIDEGSVHNFDMTYKTKAGEKIPVRFSGSAMRDESGRLVGVVGVARDVRETLKLIADLKKSKEELEEFSRTLEKRIEERTKDLTDSQQASLYLMEDIEEERKALEQKTIELEKAKAELESFSKGLEKKVEERTFELSVLYEVSKAISYTLDYRELFRLIMSSLSKMVDYDVCASFIFTAKARGDLVVKAVRAVTKDFVEEVEKNLIESFSSLTGQKISEKNISVGLEIIPRPVKGKMILTKVESFFNVPLVIKNKPIGMLNVSSSKKNAFSQDDIRLINTLSNQAAIAIERLKAVIATEKGKMEAMVESMTEGLIMIDREGNPLVCNPAARRMLGLRSEEINRRRLEGCLKKTGLDLGYEEIIFGREKLVTKDITITEPIEMVLRSNIAPVKDIGGKNLGMVIALRDITAEKEVDRMKTEFVSTVSHELRTPLTTMKEFTSIIRDEIPGKLTKEQKEYVDIIKGNIDRLARLINNLLDISKIESGRVALKKMLVDVSDLAKATFATLKSETERKNIEFKTSFPAIATNVYADPDKITQVFTNLISNAIKFTPEKGKITVEIKDTGNEIECSVADTGKGIGADDMVKLFSKFQQFGRVAGGGAKGTGLGLAISKELVEVHNGRIWAESKIGEGSKFIFTLPKYTTESLFEEYVNNGIKEAVRSDSKMSIIMVSVFEFEKLKQELSIEKLRSILKDIEGTLTKNLRRKDDLALKDDKEIIVILSSCDKKGALESEGRLEQVLKDYLTGQKLDKKIKLRLGCATYPDEAKDVKKLIAKARKS